LTSPNTSNTVPFAKPIYRRIDKNIQILDYECHSFD